MRGIVDYVDQLVTSTSAERLQSSLARLDPEQRAAVADELRMRARGASEQGRPAEAALLRHLLDVITQENSGDESPPTEGARTRSVKDALATAESRGAAGDLDAAIDVVEAALSELLGEQAESDLATDIEVMPLRITLAEHLRAAGRRARALEVLAPALGVHETYPELEGALAALATRCLSLRAVIQEELGDFNAAEADRAAAVAVAASAQDTSIVVQAEWDLAALLLKRGRVREATRRFASAVDRARAWGDAETIAAARTNYAHALLASRRPADAAREHRRALEIRLGRTEENPSGIAGNWFGLSSALRELGDTDGARVASRRGLESGLGSEMRLTAQAVYLGQSEELPSVEERDLDLGERFVEEARAEGVWLMEASIALVLARLYRRTCRPQRAMEILQELMRRMDTNGLDARLPPVVGSRVVLAELLLEHARAPQQAFDLLWPLCEENGPGVISGTLRVLSLRGSELDLPDARDAAELAFDLHESAKARPFLAQLAVTRLPPPDVSPQLLETEHRLLDRQRTLERTPSAEMDARARRALSQIRRRLEEIWLAMEQFAPDYVRMRRGDPATLTDLRHALRRTSEDPHVALLSYYVAPERTFRFLVRADEERIHFDECNVSEREVTGVAARLRRTFNGDVSGFPPLAPISRTRPGRRDLSFFEELGTRLLPRNEFFEGVDLLCIAAHGPLHLLPIHALRSKRGDILSEGVSVTYVPSASALVHLRARAAPRRRGPLRALVAGVAAASDLHREFFEADTQLFSHADVELETLSGESADRVSVRTGLTRSDLAHITCHGHYDRYEPLDSGLVLSDGLTRPPRAIAESSVFLRRRFLLTSRDMLHQQLQARLVTLRACSSAAHFAEYEGDDLVGLPRALLYAGADAVIASLWNVDQQSSLELLGRFYRHWEWGRMPAWKALSAAQLDLRRSEASAEYAHPYHWAPFVLLGDWS